MTAADPPGTESRSENCHLGALDRQEPTGPNPLGKVRERKHSPGEEIGWFWVQIETSTRSGHTQIETVSPKPPMAARPVEKKIAGLGFRLKQVHDRDHTQIETVFFLAQWVH